VKIVVRFVDQMGVSFTMDFHGNYYPVLHLAERLAKVLDVTVESLAITE
jgi:hypothetical protein